MQNDYLFFVLMTDIWAFNLIYDLNRVGWTNNTALTYYPICIIIICFRFIFTSSMNYVEIYITFIKHKKTLLMYQNSHYVYLEYFVLSNNVSRSKLKKISKRSSIPYVWVCYIVCSVHFELINLIAITWCLCIFVISTTAGWSSQRIYFINIAKKLTNIHFFSFQF